MVTKIRKVQTPKNHPLQDACLIKYTGESMHYKYGSVLVVLPETFAGQPLQYNNAYAVETRSQSRVYGRFLGLTNGEVYGHAAGQPCALIAPSKPEYPPMEIPLYEITAVARIVACLTDEREN